MAYSVIFPRLLQLSGHTDLVHEARFLNEDPHLLLSASSDSSVRLWDIRQPLAAGATQTLSGGGRPFHSADAHGTLVAAGLGRGTRLWDARTWRALRTISDTHTEELSQARRARRALGGGTGKASLRPTRRRCR